MYPQEESTWNIKALGQATRVRYRNILYLKSNTSKLVENTKVFELIIIKELGKLTP